MSNCSYGMEEACDVFGEHVAAGTTSDLIPGLNSSLVMSFDSELLEKRKGAEELRDRLPTREKIRSIQVT